MAVLAMLFGAVLGYLALAYIFSWIAGTPPATPRQFIAVYLGLLIAGVFVRACGAADGGPPNFDEAWLDLIGGPAAGFIHFTLSRGRSSKP